MKSLVTAMFIALAIAAPVAAQQSGNPSNTQAPAAQAPAPSASESQPSASGPATPVPSDDGAALPRAAVTERTTIFGLSPTAAVAIAAALLVVVILAIVSMTRTKDSYIER